MSFLERIKPGKTRKPVTKGVVLPPTEPRPNLSREEITKRVMHVWHVACAALDEWLPDSNTSAERRRVDQAKQHMLSYTSAAGENIRSGYNLLRQASREMREAEEQFRERLQRIIGEGEEPTERISCLLDEIKRNLCAALVVPEHRADAGTEISR